MRSCVPLRQRPVDQRPTLALEPFVADVADHADDLDPRHVGARRVDAEPLAEHGARTAEHGGEPLVHDADRWRAGGVAIVEAAPGDQRDPQRRRVAGIDRSPARGECRVVSLDADVAHLHQSAERQAIDQPDRLDARQRARRLPRG